MKLTKRSKGSFNSFITQEELNAILDRFFIPSGPKSIESLLVYLGLTESEYSNKKDVYDFTYAELRCKESIITAGFNDNKFASYYHKEAYGNITQSVEPIDINISVYDNLNTETTEG